MSIITTHFTKKATTGYVATAGSIAGRRQVIHKDKAFQINAKTNTEP